MTAVRANSGASVSGSKKRDTKNGPAETEPGDDSFAAQSGIRRPNPIMGKGPVRGDFGDPPGSNAGDRTGWLCAQCYANRSRPACPPVRPCYLQFFRDADLCPGPLAGCAIRVLSAFLRDNFQRK
jgi:hypothetical protein